jgi:hypothetical protein
LCGGVLIGCDYDELHLVHNTVARYCNHLLDEFIHHCRVTQVQKFKSIDIDIDLMKFVHSPRGSQLSLISTFFQVVAIARTRFGQVADLRWRFVFHTGPLDSSMSTAARPFSGRRSWSFVKQNKTGTTKQITELNSRCFPPRHDSRCASLAPRLQAMSRKAIYEKLSDD